jgi:hypothetical protein
METQPLISVTGVQSYWEWPGESAFWHNFFHCALSTDW